MGAGGDDFRIGYNSVCKDAGTSSGAPSVDFAEAARNGDGAGSDMDIRICLFSLLQELQIHVTEMELNIKWLHNVLLLATDINGIRLD